MPFLKILWPLPRSLLFPMSLSNASPLPAAPSSRVGTMTPCGDVANAAVPMSSAPTNPAERRRTFLLVRSGMTIRQSFEGHVPAPLAPDLEVPAALRGRRPAVAVRTKRLRITPAPFVASLMTLLGTSCAEELLGSSLGLQDILHVFSCCKALAPSLVGLPCLSMQTMVAAWLARVARLPWIPGWAAAVAFVHGELPGRRGVFLGNALGAALAAGRARVLPALAACDLLPGAMLQYALSGNCDRHSLFEGVILGSFALDMFLRDPAVRRFVGPPGLGAGAVDAAAGSGLFVDTAGPVSSAPTNPAKRRRIVVRSGMTIRQSFEGRVPAPLAPDLVVPAALHGRPPTAAERAGAGVLSAGDVAPPDFRQLRGAVAGSYALDDLVRAFRSSSRLPPTAPVPPVDFSPGDVDVFLCLRRVADLLVTGFGHATSVSCCVGLDHGELVPARVPCRPATAPPLPVLASAACYWNLRSCKLGVEVPSALGSHRGWEYVLSQLDGVGGAFDRLPPCCSDFGMLEHVRERDIVRWRRYISAELFRSYGDPVVELRSSLLVVASAFQAHRVVYPVLSFLSRVHRLGLPLGVRGPAHVVDVVTRLVQPVFLELPLDPLWFDQAAYLLWTAMWCDPSEHDYYSLGTPVEGDHRAVVTFVVPGLATPRVQFVYVFPGRMRTCRALRDALSLYDLALKHALVPPPAGAAPFGLARLQSVHSHCVLPLVAYSADAVARSFDLTVCMVGARVGRCGAAVARPFTGCAMTNHIVRLHVCLGHLSVVMRNHASGVDARRWWRNVLKRFDKYERRGFRRPSMDGYGRCRCMESLLRSYAPLVSKSRDLSATCRFGFARCFPKPSWVRACVVRKFDSMLACTRQCLAVVLRQRGRYERALPRWLLTLRPLAGSRLAALFRAKLRRCRGTSLPACFSLPEDDPFML